MDFQITEPFILKVDWDKVTYEFLIRIKPDASNTIVLDGAGGFQEQPIGYLFFIDILGWMNLKILLYIIMTLRYILENYLLGWGQGELNRFYLQDIANILEIVFVKLKVDSKNVLFYGSSGEDLCL